MQRSLVGAANYLYMDNFSKLGGSVPSSSQAESGEVTKAANESQF